MQINRFSEDGLRTMSRHLVQLKETFATILDYTGFLGEPACPFPGIAVTLAGDGESILLQYRVYAVELRLTAIKPEAGALRGKVTAVLVRHPLDASKPVLGTFTFSRQGETDIAGAGDEFDRELSNVTASLVLTLVHAALLHRPGDAAKMP